MARSRTDRPPRVVASPTSGRHEQTVAVTSIIAVVLALGAAAVSALTYLDQERLTEQQEQRNVQRYAARVAWWYDADLTQALDERVPRPARGPSIVIWVQNRSPVPITQVMFDFSEDRQRTGTGGEGSYILNGDMAPCTVRAVRFTIPAAALTKYRPDLPSALGAEWVNEFPTSGWILYFADPNGRWSRRLGQLDPTETLPDDIIRQSLEPYRPTAPTADCGEGG